MEQEPNRPQAEVPPPPEPAAAPPTFAIPASPAPPDPPFAAAPQAPPDPPFAAAEAAPVVDAEPRVEPIPFESTPAAEGMTTIRDAPATPEIWNGVPPAAREEAAPPAEPTRRREAVPEPAQSGANMMLAVVCWIAAATSLFEVRGLWIHHTIRSYAFSGYLALGLGILLFGFEALLWGQSRRRLSLLIFTPAALLTLAGVICLVLSAAPGRRI